MSYANPNAGRRQHVSSNFQTSLPHFPILYEAVPPSEGFEAEKLERKLGNLERLLGPLRDQNLLDALLVPDLAEEELGVRKMDSLGYSCILKQRIGVDVIPEKVVANLDPESLGEWLGKAQMENMSAFVFVGGTSSSNQYKMIVTTANSRTISAFPEVLVGNICIPGRRTGIKDSLLPKEGQGLDEPDRVFDKTQAGCTFFPTQVIWEVEAVTTLLSKYDARCKADNIAPGAILLAVTPVDGQKSIDFLRRLRVTFDPALEARIMEAEDPAAMSITIIKEMLTQIYQFVRDHSIAVPIGIVLSPVFVRNEKYMPDLANFCSRFRTGPNRAAPMGNVVDGRELAKLQRQSVRAAADELPRRPGLALVRVGDEDTGTKLYRKTLKRFGKEVGVAITSISLDSDTTTTEILKGEIKRLNEREDIDGILVHQPLPAAIDNTSIVEAISPEKDVDGVHPYTVGRLLQKQPTFHPCTPRAVVRIIRSTGMDLAGKNAVVVGAHNIIGRPLGLELLLEGCTVCTVNRFTNARSVESMCAQADVVVLGLGRPGAFNVDLLPKSCVVVDVGTSGSGEKGGMGDLNMDAVRERVRWFCPMKGGTGPMIGASLFDNVVLSAQRRSAPHALASPSA